MMQAVFELATVSPHEPAGKGIPAADWRAYYAGYHCALQVSLQVMELAVDRWRLYVRERRRRRALLDGTVAAPLEQRKPIVGEKARVVRNHLPKKRGEREHLEARELELDRSPGEGVVSGEFVYTGAFFAVSVPVDVSGSESVSHGATYRVDVKNEQPPIEGLKTVSQDGLPSVNTAPDYCLGVRQGTVPRPIRSPGRRKTLKARAGSGRV